ncbi:MAG: Fe-S cluster assembly protein SufD [Gammaproteobacteria bacterium]|nr:Fe-S cluster assembly protein SufD [Gammaproteobacteria bacterium]
MGLLDSLAADFPPTSNPTLGAWRDRAFDAARERGLPTPREEDWKYTDLNAAAARAYKPAAAIAGADSPLSALRAYRLVFVNGHFDAANSDLASMPAGISVRLLGELARTDPERAIAALNAFAKPDAKFFATLNTATARDGAYIDIADDCVLDLPLLLIFSTQSANEPRWSAPHVRINAGARSRVAVIELHHGATTVPSFVNALTEASTASGAVFAHYRVTLESPAATHIGLLRLNVGRDSAVTSYSLALSGALVRIDIDCSLTAPGGSVALNGVFIAGSNQHVDHHTKTDHRASHTTSSETYKGIADGNGRGVFNGKIIVQPGTQKIEATQASNNLLLSADAEIDTKPELEIYADDLRCAHGATVGQLDDETLFYLQTRGVPADVGRALLTFGFVQELVAEIPIPELTALVAQQLAADHPALARLLTGDHR